MLHATTEAIWRVEHPALWRAFIRRSAEVISNGGMMIEAVLFGTLHPGAHGCHLLLRCKVAIEREWDEVVSGRAASDAPEPDEVSGRAAASLHLA